MIEALYRRITKLTAKKIIPVADWAKNNDINLQSATNKAIRGTIPAFRVRGHWMIDKEAKAKIHSHVCLSKTILRGFEVFDECRKKKRLYYYNFAIDEIKDGSAKTFNTIEDYYSGKVEGQLSSKAESGIGVAIAEIKSRQNKNIGTFELSLNSRENVMRYIVYQLLRDDSIAERFIRKVPAMNNKTKREIKEYLISLEACTGFLDSLFDDAGVQFVFNDTRMPFIITASTSTYMANPEEHYIIELTLTPNIAILLTDIESLKSTLNIDKGYGAITIKDEKWVREYNLSMLLTARKNKPHILVSSSRDAIVQALKDEQYKTEVSKLPFEKAPR